MAKHPLEHVLVLEALVLQERPLRELVERQRRRRRRRVVARPEDLDGVEGHLPCGEPLRRQQRQEAALAEAVLDKDCI